MKVKSIEIDGIGGIGSLNIEFDDNMEKRRKRVKRKRVEKGQVCLLINK